MKRNPNASEWTVTTVSALGTGSWRNFTAASSAPATPAATKSIATKSRPLPRKTVAKNRCSRAPIRLRITAMNHRKAIPKEGNEIHAHERDAAGVLAHVEVPDLGGRAAARRMVAQQQH